MALSKEQKAIIKQADIIEKAFEKIIDLGGHMVVNIEGEAHDVWAMVRGDENHHAKFNHGEFIIIMP